MPYRGFSGGGFVGNFLSTTLLEQLRPAADNAGRQATVGDPTTRAAPYRSDGESWKAVALYDDATQSLVSGDGTRVTFGPTVATPWRGITFGDSRSNFKLPLTQIVLTAVSGSSTREQRAASWTSAYMGDVEMVGDYGIGGDTASAWNSASRANSKLINNAIALQPDVVFIQYGVNDISAWNGTGQAAFIVTLTNYLKALCGAFISSGVKVVFESINPFDPTASSSAFTANTVLKEEVRKAVNTNMQAWAGTMVGKAVFANTDPILVNTATGYAKTSYLQADNLGVHLNKIGAQQAASIIAPIARDLLPQRFGVFTSGPLSQPNLINWDSPAMFASTEAGTVTATTPTWNVLTAPVSVNGCVIPVGTPYAEVSFTPTVLASGQSRARFEIHATPGNCIGGAALYPIAVGDVLQGSAFITMDNGTDGGVPSSQSIDLRQRLYGTGGFFQDFGALTTTDTTLLEKSIAGRFITPNFAATAASASLTADSGNGTGYALQVYIENPVVGATVRIRVYMPVLRVISRPQPTQPTIGASPFTYTLTEGVSAQEADVVIAGGTVSAIAYQRGSGTAQTTGATSGTFRLSRGDSLVITHTGAPTATLIPR